MMKRLSLGIFLAACTAVVLAVILTGSPRTEMGGSSGFNLLWGAFWTVLFVFIVGLRALPLRDTLLWGASYGFVGWLIGPATIAGILTGHGPLWSIAEFSELFPDLIAYLLFGIALGVAYPILYQLYIDRQGLRLPADLRWAVVRGTLAGALVGLIFINRLPQIGLLPLPGMSAEMTPTVVFWVLSVLVGAILGMVVVDSEERAGVGLIRGMVYGLLWWLLVVLTIHSLISGEKVAWTLNAAQAYVDNLLGLMLFGGILALFYHLITRLQNALFSDDVGMNGRDEGIGARNLRALGGGIVGSLFGGAAFTFVMVQVGVLPTIAGILGGSSALFGLFVHFLISVIIGAMYGLLFADQVDSYGGAIGWGTAYGLFWWLLGPITLLPLLLGKEGVLSAGAALAAYPPSFLGHVAYGAITAMYFFWLEQRRKREIAASQGTVASTLVVDATPVQSPLWILLMLLAVIVPLLLNKP
ncbi:MAG: hypothetical protein ABI947_10290 [Chloroflexota bacterium]